MYGGTQTEMQRLIKDAARLDSSIDANSMSFANIVKAINVVQTEMGITGTTAKEAATTIQGSVGMMKSSWTNLVTGLADQDADMNGLVANFVDSVGTVADNILPVVETALSGIAILIEKLAPKVVEMLPSLVEKIVPSLITSATGMVNAVIEVLPSLLNTLVSAIVDNAPLLITSAYVLVGELAKGILKELPKILQVGLDLIVSLANGIAESLPELIPTIMDVILQIVDTLTAPENLSNLLKAALSIITQLGWGLVNSIPSLIDTVMVLLENITTFLMDPANLAMLVQAAIELVVALGLGIIEAIPKLITSFGKLVANITDYFKNYDWGALGKNLVDGFKKGIENAWNNLKQWFKNLFDDLIGIAKKILGIASPSKVFKKIGAFTAEGFGDGFNKAFGDVEKDIENALDFNGTTFGVNAYGSYSGGGALSGIGGTTFGTVNINIEGYNAQDDDELAEMIAEKLQIMTERKGAVFA